MSVPSPSFKDSGKKALDDLLERTIRERKVPAAFFGATDKNGELYFNCGGERVFGSPDEGQVTPDTGEFRSWSSSGTITDESVLQLFSMTKFMTAVGPYIQF